MSRNIIFNSEGFPQQLQVQKNEVYEFKEVTSEELLQKWMSGQPGVVYKKDGRLFFISVKRSMTVYPKGKMHLCGDGCLSVCKGCPRTRDLTVSYQQRIGKSFLAAVKNSWRIEKYDFIIEGVEAFNMKEDKDTFCVISCSNYNKKSTVRKTQREDIYDAKAKLAALYFEDFDGKTLAEFYQWRRFAFFGLRGK